MKTLKLFLILLICWAGVSCTRNRQMQNEANKNEMIIVQTVKATETTFTDELEFQATCFANKEANVGSSIPGKVEKIHFQPGQFVKAGSVVVSMSSEMLLLAEVEYKTLEKDFERVSRLREKNSISEQEYDHVKAKYEAAKAKYELIKKNTEITAPFDGIIAEIIVQEGESFMFSPSLDLNFSMTSGIIKIMQIHPVIVRFAVNEKLIPHIRIGQEVIVKFDAWPERNFHGNIQLIYPKLNTLTRTTDVEVKINNPSNELKPGMFARVYLKGMKITGCMIPITSIVSRKGKEYVWTVVDNKARLVEIQRHAMREDFAVVTGIDPGTEIILTRKSQLTQDALVKIQNN